MTPDEAHAIYKLLDKRHGTLTLVRTKDGRSLRVWNSRRERPYGEFGTISVNVSPPINQDGEPASVAGSLINLDPWEIAEITDEWGNKL
jgi:hypothetical protein